MNNGFDDLAAEVRNHDASKFDGEDTQKDVICSLLKQELARLGEETARNEEAAQKRNELRADLGVSDDGEMAVEENADHLTSRQAELQAEILER